jgi:hypothetical protein
MSPHGWVVRRYGFGAARVPLCPAPRRASARARPLREALRDARRQGDAAEHSLGRNAARALPALVTTTLVLVWFSSALFAPPPDESGVRIVPFEAPLPLEVALVEPELLPDPPPLPEAQPEITPPPAVQPEIAPPPPTVQPQAAPPPPAARPAPPPRIEQVARTPEPPAPPPAVRRAPARPAVPTPAAAPRFAIDAVSPSEPSAQPALEPPRRPIAFAAVQPTAARPELSAAPALPTRAPRASAPARSVRARTDPSHDRPTLALAAPALALAAPSERTPQRSARRPLATTPPRRRSRGSSVALALPTAGGAGSPAPSPPAAPAPRATRPAAAPPARRAASESPGLPGVALGSLAACISPRTEDVLKGRLVGLVGARVQCESPAGRYHFVQTRNLNAFLMRIERSPHRKPGDRCAELTFALDCLSRSEEGGR